MWRNLLLPARDTDHHRRLLTSLQHDQPYESTENKPPAHEVCVPRCSFRFLPRAGCATPTGFASLAGAKANSRLTFDVDHSGAIRLWSPGNDHLKSNTKRKLLNNLGTDPSRRLTRLCVITSRPTGERGGPGCLNRISASISGASAGVRLPSGEAAA